MDARLRAFVRQRADNTCEYCRLSQEHEPFAQFHVDHIKPKKDRGTDARSNLSLACQHCNRHKQSRIAGTDRDTGRHARLFHPRRDAWEEHFEWDGPILRGRTPIGRATIDVLAINSPEQIKLRENLIAEGMFPPQVSP